ncbi:hypothetical protein CPC08DRAFT_767490 [Agrocybe pediades]|nr:hypothetical protein CPC08DRAFT_767490 [Agrocybe pediades]
MTAFPIIGETPPAAGVLSPQTNRNPPPTAVNPTNPVTPNPLVPLALALGNASVLIVPFRTTRRIVCLIFRQRAAKSSRAFDFSGSRCCPNLGSDDVQGTSAESDSAASVGSELAFGGPLRLDVTQAPSSIRSRSSFSSSSFLTDSKETGAEGTNSDDAGGFAGPFFDVNKSKTAKRDEGDYGHPTVVDLRRS